MTDENLYRVAGKFELLDRILPKFKATGHRVLIFFQMTQIMNIMEDFLRWKGLSFLRLDGSTKADDRTSMLKVFNRAEDPPFAFLLSTRAGGLGLNLQTADTVIIFDSDWNPHQDLQAQDRAHRIGQTKEVRILRLITAKSIEENILARAQYKLDMDGKVIQAGKFDNKTTDNEREELLRALFGTEEDDVDEEDKEGKEMLDDQELNEIIARSDDELVMFNKMDAERHKAEEEQWRKSGHKGPVPPRLMQDDELPAIFLEDPELPEEADLPIEYGRGSRKRKDIVYDDGLNDNQFLAALDGGDLEGYIEKKRATKAVREERRQARIANGESPSSDEEGGDKNGDSDTELPPQPSEVKSKKRVRKPTKANDEVDEDAEPETRESSPGKKQRKKVSPKKKLFADVDPDAPETLEATTRKALTRVGEGLFRIVEELEIEDHEGYVFPHCVH
jgi:ATP-dependent helicase STH1/SNF2